MNRIPIPQSPPSSHGSASLEVRLVPSPRLLAALAAWGAAGGLAIAQCEPCTAPGRALLFAGCAAALAASVAAALPGVVAAAPRGLRGGGGRWQLEVGRAWLEVELERAIEVLRAGWWLQLRAARSGRRSWVWVDAARTPRGSYRALCRALQQQRRATPAVAAGRSPAGFDRDGARRGSRRDAPPPP